MWRGVTLGYERHPHPLRCRLSGKGEQQREGPAPAPASGATWEEELGGARMSLRVPWRSSLGFFFPLPEDERESL